LHPQNAERSAQSAQFGDAGVERIAFARDKVSGDKRNVGTQIVCHVDGSGDLVRRHVVTNVNIAELSYAEAVEFRGKIRNWHIDALDCVTQATGSESVGRS
jgi:hypothetical protein